MVRLLILCLVLPSCDGVFSNNGNYSFISDALTIVFEKYYINTHKPVLLNSPRDDTLYSNDYVEILVNAVRSSRRIIPIVFVLHSEMHPSFYNVLIVRSYESFLRQYEMINTDSYDLSGLYTIICFALESNVVGIIFEKLSLNKIINAIVIHVSNAGKAQVYSNFPYHEAGCGIINPKLLANISYNNSEIDIDLFPNHLVNMHGCFLKAGTYDVAPFTIVGNNKFDGMEVVMVETIAKHHNFTAQYVLNEDGTSWGMIREKNSTGLMGLIQNKQVDFGFGTLGVTAERSFYLKQGIPHFISEFIIAVPTGRLYTSFEKLYKPFDTIAWIFISIALIGSIVVSMVMFGKHNVKYLRILKVEEFETPVLITWLAFLGNPLAKCPRKHKTKAIVMSWMVMGLLVRTLYQGAMFKYFHNGQHTKPVQTIEDIQTAKLYYYLYEPAKRFFASSPEVLKMLKFINPEETNPKLSQLLNGDLDGVILLPSSTLNYFNQQNIRKGFVRTGTDVIATYAVGIYYPKDSPLNQMFDEDILNLQAAGLMKYWKGVFGITNYKEINTVEPTPLDMDTISGIFIIWLIFTLLSVTSFCIELLWKW